MEEFEKVEKLVTIVVVERASLEVKASSPSVIGKSRGFFSSR
jgi:hypothetical protein